MRHDITLTSLLCAAVTAGLVLGATQVVADTTEASSAGQVVGGDHVSSLHTPIKLDPNALQEFQENGHVVEKRHHKQIFPLYNERLAEKGIHLPKPWGLAIMGTLNDQEQNLTKLGINLGKGAPPDPNVLYPIPLVNLSRVESKIKQAMVKLDLWVLPFMNVFAAVGKMQGDVSFDVDIDTSAILPPIACRNGCPVVSIPFDTQSNMAGATVGAIFAFGIKNWFASLEFSRTFTIGDKTDGTITSNQAGFRGGRNFHAGNGWLISPYLGVSYLDVDQTVHGHTGLANAFPDGDDLFVSYTLHTENVDKWQGIIGLNLSAPKSAFMIQGEYAAWKHSKRFTLSVTKRF
ncbi:MAG: hypothetical protein COA78_38165 [Blastopirellula sp.]|nr:MAG: hypothetical protein COA78_38165 [Blastopirellula sp.]